MTTKLIALCGAVWILGLSAERAQAQIATYPTPPPAVTAENENWYQLGEPIIFGGLAYHPSGPVRHFNRNEMVQVGSYGGVPVYIKTTLEPWSTIFIPLPGGLVRPYEQRRAGELAGTVGSVPPAYPVVLPAEERDRIGAALPQASAPPAGTLVGAWGTPDPAATGRMQGAPETAGTTGAMPAVRREAPSYVRIGPPPSGLNGVYIEFDGRRWFASGPAFEVARDPLRQIGTHQGFPVYATSETPDVIYLPTVAGRPGLMTPYESR